MVVLHATDPATVFLSVAARSPGAVPEAVEKALYDDRTLLRMLAMRRTMFVAPTDLVPVLQASTANGLAVKQRATYTRIIERGGDVADVPALFAEAAEAAHRALLARGEATGAQLSADVPLLRTQVDPAPGKSYSRPGNITTWILVTLGCEGRIVRGRRTGRGPAASTGGRPSRRGCRTASRTSRPPRPAPTSPAAGCARSGPPRPPT
ncbi:winged helix DNA-binding domain-containing protein [Actinomadura madurae]|nr:crosslink repair DNA glycosylase YcaQ family protein [Actinomadura madurae]MCQ0020442.1 winged helix DNA-binding domain-containing protein [Actinomadura madurae]